VTEAQEGRRTGILFDLDGTLIDSVYQHVLAWREALEAEGIDIPVWKIHRRIGMSGGLFARALLREVGAPIGPEWRSACRPDITTPSSATAAECARCPAPSTCWSG
jgi:beta-phosphoglucomutase-like phosphatase (HAD superfamily)